MPTIKNKKTTIKKTKAKSVTVKSKAKKLALPKRKITSKQPNKTTLKKPTRQLASAKPTAKHQAAVKSKAPASKRKIKNTSAVAKASKKIKAPARLSKKIILRGPQKKAKPMTKSAAKRIVAKTAKSTRATASKPSLATTKSIRSRKSAVTTLRKNPANQKSVKQTNSKGKNATPAKQVSRVLKVKPTKKLTQSNKIRSAKVSMPPQRAANKKRQQSTPAVVVTKRSRAAVVKHPFNPVTIDPAKPLHPELDDVFAVEEDNLTSADLLKPAPEHDFAKTLAFEADQEPTFADADLSATAENTAANTTTLHSNDEEN